MTSNGTGTATKASIASMLSVVASARHDPAARILNVDLLAVLAATLLPWSTSGFIIVMMLWVVALLFALDLKALTDLLKRPICALPVAIFALALFGTLWSDATWGVRLYAVGPTVKLLALPLLIYHFERSSRGMWVFVAFLASCTLLTAMSWLTAFDPALALKPSGQEVCGVFVKNYIDQGQEFALCAAALAYPMMIFLRTGQRVRAAWLAAVALCLIVNLAFVVAPRTALVALPVLLVAFAMLYLNWRSAILMSVIAVILGLALMMSPRLCPTFDTLKDYWLYKNSNAPTSTGLRLEFWKKSLHFFGAAPLAGHGTGSIRGLFEGAAVGKAGAEAVVVGNPHNQTLNFAIQWGAIGVVLLYAMWLVHLLLFRGDGLVASIGVMVVLQNILTSLFNSHLSDFHEGWMYVLGVGVAGGMMLKVKFRQGKAATAGTLREDELSARSGELHGSGSGGSIT
jgi:hypothetical protein